MKQHFAVVVVMAIGPNSKLEYILDTLTSFQFYTTSTHKVIIIDDSQKDLALEIKSFISDIDIIKTKKNSGNMAGLYINLATAYQHAIQNYHFDALLKIDDDALVINENPEKDAIHLFKANPRIGIAGLHVRGQYPLDFMGTPWDNNYPRKTILVGTCSWKLLKRPLVNLTLRKLFFKAFYNGYEAGEYVFGGSYFVSEHCLIKLNEAGFLPLHSLGKAILGEDHLFSLLAKVVGLELGDLASGNLPFGLAWKGLPASPEMLLQKNKKIIHSTRKWENMNEADVRGYFKKLRQKAKEAITVK
jgi:glycosyltransferase involved in cell wall biosynthesis